jgi:PAS domain S-box-containing protein
MTPEGSSPAKPPASGKLAAGGIAAIGEELTHARDRAAAIIEAFPPLLVLDEDLCVKSANASFYKHFGVSPVQTENCPLYQLGNGQWNIPKLRALLKQVLPQHSYFSDFEVAHEFEAIGRRTVLLSGRQVNGRPEILLLIDDVTERMESQAAMRTSEIRYRRLFEAARDGILILDPDTRKITDANPFMSELLGYPRDELLGKELWEIGLLQDEAASRAAFSHLQRNTFIRYEDLPLRNKEGHRHEVEFVSNVYDEDGRNVIQCNIRDITERRRMEDALRDANNRLTGQAAELEQVVAERTTQLRETIGELEGFSYSMSHDMRAPLRAMQGIAQFLLDEYGGKLDERGIEYLHRIMQSAVRLDRLIQDVLSYTRILHGALPMRLVDLDALVRDIVAAFPNGQPVKPEIKVTGTLPKVIGNESLLAQCVFNLLSNGAKFVLPGTTPRLQVSAEAIDETLVRVWFKDNGIGIAPQDHDRIFRMFERIHPATEYDGTGIGLTIVRKAVERMGAQVGLESALGKGSSFWIQLKTRMTDEADSPDRR